MDLIGRDGNKEELKTANLKPTAQIGGDVL